MRKISKYKNTFAKGYIPNCSEEIFAIKKITFQIGTKKFLLLES